MSTTSSELEKVLRRPEVALRSREVQNFLLNPPWQGAIEGPIRLQIHGFGVDLETVGCDDGPIEGYPEL